MRCLTSMGKQKKFSPNKVCSQYKFMANKRNIVIKVTYPVPGKAVEKSAPKMVTVWHVKRIFLAVGALLLTLVSTTYVFSNNMQKTGLDNSGDVMLPVTDNESIPVENSNADVKNLAIPEQVVLQKNILDKPTKIVDNKNIQIINQVNKRSIKKQLNKKDNNKNLHSKSKVSRASLSYGLNNKEPTAEIVRPVVVSNKKPQWIYYFIELKSMAGNNVYHEWLKDGVIVSKQKSHISGDTWRSSSRKLFSDTEKGKWSARLVDENGHLLNERKFRIE